MYKLIKNFRTGEIVNIILRIEDNCFISMSEDNTDYQAYLAWLAEGGIPLPAENT